jgi:hypothetical protein
VTYLTWTEDNLLRQVSYQGKREDRPAREFVRRAAPPSKEVGLDRLFGLAAGRIESPNGFIVGSYHEHRRLRDSGI